MPVSSTLPLADLYAPIRHELAQVERLFDEEVLSQFPFINDLCATLRSYRGKMLRPALVLLSGRACGELVDAHFTLASVVELVHMATLVHDDVLDNAAERRKQPTIRALCGNTAAVLLGDYLISHAFHLCSGLNDQHASRRIGATTNVVCEGELLQNYHCGNRELTEAEYLDIVKRKTGALTAVACELGAFYATGDAEIARELAGYGMNAGIAFQIVDDVLDILGDAEEVGKTLGTDVILGKMTLPTIHCLTNDRNGSSSTVGAMIGRPGGRQDRVRLHEALTASGSIEYAISMADQCVQRALAHLDELPDSDAKSSLTAMAEFIVQRRY